MANRSNSIGGAIRIDLDVDQREGERLGRVGAAGAKRAGQRLDPQPAQRILDEMDRRPIDFDRAAIEHERAVVLQRVALLGRTGGEVVGSAAGGVDLIDQMNQHALVLAAHALHGHQIELREEARQHVGHLGAGQLGLVEAAELERGDADGRARRGRRRVCHSPAGSASPAAFRGTIFQPLGVAR